MIASLHVIVVATAKSFLLTTRELILTEQGTIFPSDGIHIFTRASRVEENVLSLIVLHLTTEIRVSKTRGGISAMCQRDSQSWPSIAAAAVGTEVSKLRANKYRKEHS